MTLPKWNDEWEKSDPLEGRRGWNSRRIINVAVALAIAFMVFGVLAPRFVVIDLKERERQRRAILGLEPQAPAQP